MQVIVSKANPRSSELQANRLRMCDMVQDLRAKVEQVAQGGGHAACQKHLARGKLLPRVRVEQLLDPGTPFLEIGQLAAFGMYDDEAPGAGIIAGIACRVVKTAQRMAVATVAVFSDADAKARHVRMADEAVRIGPAPAHDSYLLGERILAAAAQTGAGAIHPGYGFLSENPGFAAACERAGIVFIGPPASAVRAMGSKSAAKELMHRAGVPLTPGYHGEEQSSAFLAQQADSIGYPVLIKASAGGGGKGMRSVSRAEDFSDALHACRREAMNAFGDDRVLLEKLVLGARHIEVQVFADVHGNAIHSFERDCSVQRRHQKILEEAPAPGMTAELRAAMGNAAVNAAKAVGYVGAGAVEFIVSPDGSFSFMEMNTRLQVEHPVTEMITGVDLVEWQLSVACGEPLPLNQEQVSIEGHAIEARVYAEDPMNRFLPCTGRLLHVEHPRESRHVRVDSGVEQGDEITPHYDAMVAKLIVWDQDRVRALARLRAALGQYRIVGVGSNLEFLGRLVTCSAFANADLDTALIAREQAYLFAPPSPLPDEAWLLTALAELLRERAANDRHAAADRDLPWRALDGFRVNGRGRQTLTLRSGETTKAVQIVYDEDAWQLAIGERAFHARGEWSDGGHLRAELGDRQMSAVVIVAGEQRHVFLDNRHFVLVRVDRLRVAGASPAGSAEVRSPLPGKVIALLTETETLVQAGAPLVLIEAMKMEHTVTAPSKGVVKRYHFLPGDQVADGLELLEFEVTS